MIKIENGILMQVQNEDITDGMFVVPSGVTKIGGKAFRGCSLLNFVVIPAGVISIGGMAFAYCEAIHSITLPEGLETIGAYAFYGCRSLRCMNIPSTIKKIGSDAFYGTRVQTLRGCYKAFNPDMTCRDYQYELGEWSEELEDIRVGDMGYHFATNLFDVFNHYSGELDKDFIICFCELDYGYQTAPGTNDCVAYKIKPVKRLTEKQIVKVLNNECSYN